MSIFVRALAALALSLALPLAALAQMPAPIAIGIVGWPLDPADALHALVSDVEDCLTARIRAVAPEIAIVPQRAIRDALFPLLEPATQPQSEEEFAKLLARDDVRARLSARGLRYVVAFAGGTRREDWQGYIGCGVSIGGGGCLGFMWRGERTTLDAVLWSLDGSPTVRREAAKAEGTSVMPAFGLPIPLMAHTHGEACRELGTRIANVIRESAALRPAPPDAPAKSRD
jgi:hypothetical protein